MAEEPRDTANKATIDSAPATTPTTAPKKKKTSHVWNEFEEYKEKGKVNAKCNHCNKVLGAHSKNGTSSLRRHLKGCQIYRNKQRQINQMLLKVNDVKGKTSIGIYKDKFDPEVTREAIAKMIILHEYPFSMVHHIGFRNLLSTLQPTFKVVGRNTIRADCIKIYEKEKQVLSKSFDKLQGRISLTSDMWTSGQNIGYMSLTAHYIDDNWKLQKRILCFCDVDDRHTGENIAKALLEKMYEWNIDRKVVSMTLDNCSVNDVVVRDLLRKLQPKGTLLLNGKLFQVRCCAHILNLVVQDGLKKIGEVTKKIHKAVKFIRSSPQRQRKFEGVCVQVKAPHKKLVQDVSTRWNSQVKAPHKKLVQDVSTRWNSTYMMLDSALEFKEALSRYAEIEDDFEYAPCEEEWKNARIVSNCLKVFYDATEILSGTRYTTVNRYFNLACNIYLQLDEWSSSLDPFIVAMALKMKEKFHKYWNINSVVFAIASILDPRIKMKSVTFYFPQIYGSEFEEKIGEIRDSLTSLYNEYAAQSSMSNQGCPWKHNTDSHATRGSEIIDDSGGSSSSTFVSKLKRFDSFLEESSQNVRVKTDLEAYLAEDAHPVQRGKGLDDDSFDILSWWEYNAPKYPIMGNIARDILAIPASTVASESAFSTGGRVVDQYRSSMRPKTVEALICAQDWIRKALEDETPAKDTLAFETVLKAMDEINMNESNEVGNEAIQMNETSQSRMMDSDDYEIISDSE